jgi:hypothetical protein
MTQFARSRFRGSTHDRLQEDKKCSVELDRLFYALTNGESMWCSIRRDVPSFPRNLIYFGGGVFRVSLLSFSTSALPAVTNLVIGRMTERLHSVSNDCNGIYSGRRFQVIAFESNSKLVEIEKEVFFKDDSLRSICLPASVESLGHRSFESCESLCSLTFESGSKLTRIGLSALSDCLSLRWICLPASVDFLGRSCFSGCRSLSSFTFESGSKLTRIEANAFFYCLSLESICLPATLQKIDPAALSNSGLSKITIEEGNQHFRVSGGCLLAFDGLSVIRYFGRDKNATLSRDIQILGPGCFRYCSSLSSLSFESGSQLTRIEANALYHCLSVKSISLPGSLEFIGEYSFTSCTSLSSLTFESGARLTRIEADLLSNCSALQSIHLPASLEFIGRNSFWSCSALKSLTFESGSQLAQIEGSALWGCDALNSILIPRSIKELGKGWANPRSLRQVIFESALSLRIMIETGKVHLIQDFEIKFVEHDCGLDFRGYSVQPVPGANDIFRLVTIGSPT